MESLFNRHFPDTEVIGRDLPSLGGPRQRNSIAADPLTAKTARCSAPLGRNSLLCVHQGVPLPSSAVASDLISRSRWCGRRPQLDDQHQDFLEHLSRPRDLGHLKGRVAAVAHDLGADLDQLLAQAGQRPRLRRLRHRPLRRRAGVASSPVDLRATSTAEQIPPSRVNRGATPGVRQRKGWSWRRCAYRKIATRSRRDGAESLGFAGGAPDGDNTARYLGKYVLIFNI